MLQITKNILLSFAQELKKFIELTNLSIDTICTLLEVTEDDLNNILSGNYDFKLSELIDISLKIKKIPKVYYDNNNVCQD